jgi:lipopolysaccharide export system permease protein
MLNGTVEQGATDHAQLSVLKFERYVFNLDQFAEQQHQQTLQTSERYLSELFSPHLAKDPNGKTRRILLAEAHNRISAPLYCLAFALIALGAITRGRRARGAYAFRLTVAAVAAGILRLVGYGAQGFVVRHPTAFFVLYLIPALGAALAVLEIHGVRIDRLLPVWDRAVPEPVP